MEYASIYIYQIYIITLFIYLYLRWRDTFTTSLQRELWAVYQGMQDITMDQTDVK